MRHSLTWAALLALAGLCLPFMGAMLLPAAVWAAAEEAPQLPRWGEVLPDSIRTTALDSDRVLDEKPCDWRPLLESIFQPAVADCRTAREAVLCIAARMGELTGVHYSMERRHPCMNAQEALAEKKVSCTGQSILLVCALRSVGIPARAVGIRTWNHVRGNHTWVEAWFEGQWHMIEFNERDFNTPWVMEAIGMLNPAHPAQRILAAQEGGRYLFPTVWNGQARIAAEDVTERYLTLARAWYAGHGVPEGFQKLMVDVFPRTAEPKIVVLEDAYGKEISRAELPGTATDVRQFASLLLPRGQQCVLHLQGHSERYPLTANDAAVQLLFLKVTKQ